MTVIAFKDGEMVSDSQVTDEDGNFTLDSEKIFMLPSGGILGTAGDDDIRNLYELVEHVTKKEEFPTKDDLSDTRCSFFGLLALPDCTLWYIDIHMVSYDNTDEWNAQIGQINEDHYAIGSGGQIALGAMDVGATAQEAVNAAIERNAYCGGDLQYGVIPKWKRKQ